MVDDVVGIVDGSCACVARGDVAAGGGDNGVAVGSSLGAVCITASAVQVEVVWEAVSTIVGPHLIIQASRSAVLPLSSPSLSPFSYPSRLPSSSVAVLAFPYCPLNRFLCYGKRLCSTYLQNHLVGVILIYSYARHVRSELSLRSVMLVLERRRQFRVEFQKLRC